MISNLISFFTFLIYNAQDSHMKVFYQFPYRETKKQENSEFCMTTPKKIYRSTKKIQKTDNEQRVASQSKVCTQNYGPRSFEVKSELQTKKHQL